MSYDAFISYSHAADGRLAPALQSVMHHFAKPWYRLRAVRIFRDQTSLSATPQLWASIEAALAESRFFILLASPESAASDWVRKEVDYWLAHKSASTLLLVLTDGDIVWDPSVNDFGWPASTALPANLSRAFPAEPRFSDLRQAKAEQDLTVHNLKFLDAVADLSAAIRGLSKDEVVGEDVRQHRVTKRWEWGIGTALVALTLLAVAYAYEASVQRDAAVARGLAARAEILVEQRGILLETAALLAVEAMRRSPGVERPSWLQRLTGLLPEGLRTISSRRQTSSLDTDAAMRKVLALLPERVAEMPCAVDGEVKEAAFSPDGRYLATLAGDRVVRVWSSSTGALRAGLATEGASRLVFRPHAEQLLVLSGGRATVWDFTNGAAIATLAHKGIWNAAFGGAGEFLVTVSGDEVTRLWETTTYQEVAQMHSSAPVYFVTAAAGAEEVVAWSNDIAEVFRSPGQPAQQFDVSASGGNRFTYSPDGRYLAQVTPSQYLTRLMDRRLRQQLLFEERHWVLAFSPDGRYVALGSPEWDAHVYDLETCSRAGQIWKPGPGGQLVMHYAEGRSSCRRFDTVRHDDSVMQVTLSREGRLLGTTSRDRTARVWEAYRGREVLRLLEAVEGDVSELAFSPDGEHVTAWGSKLCRTWRSRGHRQTVAIEHPDAVGGIAFDATGQRVATLSLETWSSPGALHVWALPEGRGLGQIAVPGFGRHSVALSPDGSRVAVDAGAIYGVATGDQVGEVPRVEGAVRSGVSADWSIAVHLTDGGELVMLNLATSDELARLRVPEGDIAELEVSTDGCCIATATKSGALRVWRWKAGGDARLLLLDSAVNAMRFDREARRLAVILGDDADLVAVLDVERGRRLAALRHEARVTDADFSPDGGFVVTSSVDRTVRVWDLADQVAVAQFSHDADVLAVRFSPDGKHVLSTGGRSDRTARLWLWRPADLIAEACARLSRNLTREEWAQYLGTEGYRETCPATGGQRP